MVRAFKEPFAAVSHWVGALLAVIGTAFLLALANGDRVKLLGFSIYGASLIALYGASSLYHSIRASERVENLLRKFDHAGIYLLIAGTYVPVCLLQFSPAAGRVLIGVQALCAAIGIAATFLLSKFPEALNMVLYLVMGWMAVAMIGTIAHWPSYAVGWLFSGGIVYSIGAVVFAVDKPHLVPGRFSAHDLWHLFVLGGSACHFMLMVTFVAPASRGA